MNFNDSKFNLNFLVGASLLALTACGGSDDPEPESVNVAPSVTVSGKTALEGSEVTITADGQDSDGTIASYSWIQKSGATASLTGSDSATVEFSAPAVIANEDIILTVTVTDDGGATASSDVTVSITANILNVTLNGLVTDGPIANANVEVTVGNQIFTTTADGVGLYSVPLSLDDSFADQIVRVSATGEEANSTTKLVSYVGAFAELDNAAGEDDTLTNTEAFGVNVTHLTSANAALMEGVNGGLPY